MDAIPDFQRLVELEHASDWPALHALATRLCAAHRDAFEPYEARALASTFLERHEEAIEMYEAALARYVAANPAAGLGLVAGSVLEALTAAGVGFEDRRRGRLLYNLACELAYVGRADEALQRLADAVNSSPLGRWTREAQSDSYFDSLRADPRFVAIVDRRA